jgi:hypothetical protein
MNRWPIFATYLALAACSSNNGGPPPSDASMMSDLVVTRGNDLTGGGPDLWMPGGGNIPNPGPGSTIT